MGKKKFLLMKNKVQDLCPTITAGMYIKASYKHMVDCYNGHARPCVIEFKNESNKLRN